ncbi:MAG: endonuclease VIII [Gammaproteobacteria bacterium]|nr:endonuclease VIII [Gammaproteobacteria bacterium]
MPEGPEIRLAADRVAEALAGRIATRVVFDFDRLRQYEDLLSGHRVSEIKTRGKAMLTCFDNGWVIYSHNQLYGRWYVCPPGEFPDTARHLRLAIHNNHHSALLYSASDIEVMPVMDVDKHPFLARLGPDILSDRPSAEQIVDRLRTTQFCNRQLAGLLLDQGFLAGLGNYLRAEVLNAAGLHPLRKPADCSERQLHKLARIIIKLTLRSYRTQGVINPPSLVKRLKAEGKTLKQDYRFAIYNRAGQACYLCGHAIDCSNAGGRKMYFCPNCQV